MQTSADEESGANAYVGYCGFCDVLTQSTPFKRGIATNVGGPKPPKKAASDGWHIAKADGLPNRIVTSIAMDPSDPKTIYVALGGYGRKWAPPGATGDALTAVGTGHVFRSTDAGQTFTDVSGDLPDTPANWVMLHGDQVVVGNDLGAFISSDRNGSAYAPLGHGLPNVPVLHIAPKPGDPGTLVVATYGRGAYTYRFPVSAAPLPGITPKPTPTACAASGGFTRANVRVLRRGVRFDVARRASAKASVDVFQVSSGRRVLAQRLVKRFRNVTGSFSWSGRTGSRGRLRDGYYFARFSEAFGGGRVDVRRVTLQRVHGRFHLRPSFYRRASCGLLTSYKLERPVFGGRSTRALNAAYRLSSAGRVTVTVRRSGRLVRRFKTTSARAHHTYRLRLSARRLKRGTYTVRLQAVSGSRKVTATLTSRRL